LRGSPWCTSRCIRPSLNPADPRCSSVEHCADPPYFVALLSRHGDGLGAKRDFHLGLLAIVKGGAMLWPTQRAAKGVITAASAGRLFI